MLKSGEKLIKEIKNTPEREEALRDCVILLISIMEMNSADLLEAFADCIRLGAGVESIPYVDYKREILSRMERGNIGWHLPGCKRI